MMVLCWLGVHRYGEWSEPYLSSDRLWLVVERCCRVCGHPQIRKLR